MNILFLVSPNSPFIKQAAIYGSAMQMLLLKNNFESMGHNVVISGTTNIDLSLFDIAHITMIDFDNSIYQFNECRKNSLPVVVKTINSWSSSKQLDLMARDASAITVESPDEKMMVLGRFGKQIDHKVYNLLPAVDNRIVNHKFSWDQKSYVHINGRYDTNKNHYNVILACKELNLPVITAGDVYDKNVYEKCCSLQYGDVLQELDKIKLSDVYNKSRIYVCASEQEICSTSICESIKCECNIVSSSTNWGNSNYSQDGFYVYQYGSSKDLADKIKQAYESKQQKNQWWDERRLAEEYLFIFKRHQNVKG